MPGETVCTMLECMWQVVFLDLRKQFLQECATTKRNTHTKLLFLNHLQYEKYSIKVLQLIVKINRINRDAMYAHIWGAFRNKITTCITEILNLLVFKTIDFRDSVDTECDLLNGLDIPSPDHLLSLKHFPSFKKLIDCSKKSYRMFIWFWAKNTMFWRSLDVPAVCRWFCSILGRVHKTNRKHWDQYEVDSLTVTD